ncbi:MAG: lytic murein transglycosylase [Patescibacteria group bacterium]
MSPMCFRFITFFLALTFLIQPVFAQEVNDAVLAQEAKLRAELITLEEEIAKQQQILQDKQRESVSLERDIAILNAQITKAQLNVRAQNILIQQLGKDISAKSLTIKELEEKLIRGQESLAELLRKTNEADAISLVEMVLSGSNFNDFFSDLDAYSSIKRSLNTLFVEIRDTKTVYTTEKETLSKRRDKESDIRAQIEADKRVIEKKGQEKKSLLSLTKNQEKVYQNILSERKKRAAEIRSALFALRDTAAIPFGTALNYANEAFAKTQIRPAFLLAILTQESNLGANVGTCNRPGDPPEKSWREIMPGPTDNSWRDDQTTYLALTAELGLNPDTMPLSCPWQGGWGGAMGPSQFIPTTWNTYRPRVTTALGKAIPNPWEPRDAFMASAIYLSDLGASEGGYTAERRAALKYYAGSNWNKPQNSFYGNEVMVKAQNIQENMIDPLQNL